MDGYELVERLKVLRGNRLLHVTISGYALSQDLERSRAAVFHHHLSKPVDIESLLESIETPKWHGLSQGSR